MVLVCAIAVLPKDLSKWSKIFKDVSGSRKGCGNDSKSSDRESIIPFDLKQPQQIHTTETRP